MIDVNAAGYGWFVDGTPLDDAEFDLLIGELTASQESVAMGRMDLLTVVMHEIGHVLGYRHGDDDGVMGATLKTATRHVDEFFTNYANNLF